jgi:hypothetical protein
VHDVAKLEYRTTDILVPNVTVYDNEAETGDLATLPRQIVIYPP